MSSDEGTSSRTRLDFGWQLRLRVRFTHSEVGPNVRGSRPDYSLRASFGSAMARPPENVTEVSESSSARP
jgi:hypothetical protein